jgi:hypothetical protein
MLNTSKLPNQHNSHLSLLLRKYSLINKSSLLCKEIHLDRIDIMLNSSIINISQHTADMSEFEPIRNIYKGIVEGKCYRLTNSNLQHSSNKMIHLNMLDMGIDRIRKKH